MSRSVSCRKVKTAAASIITSSSPRRRGSISGGCYRAVQEMGSRLRGNDGSMEGLRHRRSQVLDEIGPFPREQVAVGLAPEVAVSRGAAIDRLVQRQVRADAARGQAAELADALDGLLQLVVADGS